MVAVVDRVRELVSPLVDDADLALYDIEFNGGVVRVLVDDPDGLDIDAIARLSRSIGRVLDEHDPIPGRYTLEVSSPGLERPLRTRAHFEGAVGSEIKVKLVPGVDGERRLRGVVTGVGPDEVRLSVDGDEVAVSLPDIASARTVFEWGPGPKPGHGRSDDEVEDTGRDHKEATRP